MQRFYDCYHERCDSVKKGGDQRFNNDHVLVGCNNGHFIPGYRKLENCKDARCGLWQGYYCPTCKIRIELEAAAAPALPFVAGRSAGKSVLLAALAGELRQYAITSQLGIRAEYVEDY